MTQMQQVLITVAKIVELVEAGNSSVVIAKSCDRIRYVRRESFLAQHI